MWNNRLFAFFPQFMKKMAPAATDKSMAELANAKAGELKAIELWEIKLAWSEYRKGQWTPKQLSTDAVYNPVAPTTDLSSYVFVPPRLLSSPSSVVTDVYHKRSTTPAASVQPSPPVVLLSAALETKDYSSMALPGSGTAQIKVCVPSLRTGEQTRLERYRSRNFCSGQQATSASAWRMRVEGKLPESAGQD